MGKASGPPRCKICEQEHWGSVCTKFNHGIRVLSPTSKPAPKRLALPAPAPKQAAIAQQVERGSSKSDVAGSDPAGRSKKPRKAKKAKPKTSDHRKAYLADKAKERRAAEKLGMTVAQYREHQA